MIEARSAYLLLKCGLRLFFAAASITACAFDSATANLSICSLCIGKSHNDASGNVFAAEQERFAEHAPTAGTERLDVGGEERDARLHDLAVFVRHFMQGAMVVDFDGAVPPLLRRGIAGAAMLVEIDDVRHAKASLASGSIVPK